MEGIQGMRCGNAAGEQSCCYAVEELRDQFNSHDPGQLKMYCVICWFEGTTELVDWFDSRAEARAEAKELNQAAEHSKEVSNDFYTAELCSDWS